MIKVIWPERISLRYWANALVADYFTENLPALQDENNWQKWAAQIAGTGTFLAASVPSPIGINGEMRYKEWNEWAKAVYVIMSNEYN
jgi:hypothetical protein